MTPESGDRQTNPYYLVAACSGGASLLVACIGLLIVMSRAFISDGAMWAIAAMVAAPAAMGIGVAFFMGRPLPKG